MGLLSPSLVFFELFLLICCHFGSFCRNSQHDLKTRGQIVCQILGTHFHHRHSPSSGSPLVSLGCLSRPIRSSDFIFSSTIVQYYELGMVPAVYGTIHSTIETVMLSKSYNVNICCNFKFQCYLNLEYLKTNFYAHTNKPKLSIVPHTQSLVMIEQPGAKIRPNIHVYVYIYSVGQPA